MMLLAVMGVKKYFIAIVIPGPVGEEIEAIKSRLFADHGLKGSLRSPAHITLHRPFEWREEKENILIEKLGAFEFGAHHEITISGFSSFPPRVIYAGVAENPLLFELQKRLMSFAKRELRLFNESDDLRGFHPHVTIAFRDLKKPLFYELEKQFRGRHIQGSFLCNGFSLLKLEAKWEELRFFRNAESNNLKQF